MIAISNVTIGGLVVAALVVLVLLFMLRKMINIVQQGEVGVVKRLGEYRKTHDAGLVIIAPFIEALQRVDMREIPRTGDRQEVITKDNLFPASPSNPNLSTRNALRRAQEILGIKDADVRIYYDPSKSPQAPASS